MGSKSDWETMRHADEILTRFAVPHECRVVSAHRTHLPGMAAAQTVVPVLGVPVESHALKGMDSLLSIVQMPGGIPVGTMAIGKAGATNAALLAIAILSNTRPELREELHRYRRELNAMVREQSLP